MIRQPLFAIISFICFLVVGYFIVDRCLFLYSAERANGRVIKVVGHNSWCGYRRSRHPCTEFDAVVEFSTQVSSYHTLEVSAGSARDYYQPLSRASLRVGSVVSVVYDPSNPKRAYNDSLWGVWGMPIMIAMFQLSSLLASMSEPKNKKA
jgi:hypothetical protein